MIKKTIIHCDYDEIESLASKVFGCKDYSFVAVEECENDSSHEFEVEPLIEEYKKLYNNEILQIKAGDVPTFHNFLLLNLLHEAGHLEAGDYVVSVSW